jgi:hypothetical protein
MKKQACPRVLGTVDSKKKRPRKLGAALHAGRRREGLFICSGLREAGVNRTVKEVNT